MQPAIVLPAGFLRMLLGGVLNEECAGPSPKRYCPPSHLLSTSDLSPGMAKIHLSQRISEDRKRDQSRVWVAVCNTTGAIPPPVKVSEHALVSAYIRPVTLQTGQQRPGPSQGSRLVDWMQRGWHCCPSPRHQASPKGNRQHPCWTLCSQNKRGPLVKPLGKQPFWGSLWLLGTGRIQVSQASKFSSSQSCHYVSFQPYCPWDQAALSVKIVLLNDTSCAT